MRIIAHLDMDAFFAAIEERDHEWLRGKPVVVGADPKEGKGRGVVSTANYKAREYGIRSALPISKAWQFSEAARKSGKEPAIFMLGSWKRYSETSKRIMEIVHSRVSLVEQASVDEMYLDLSFAESYGAAEKLCRELKTEIMEKEKLTCSIGIGPNKLIAKIASDRNKPDGLMIIQTKDIETFLDPLPIRTIPGIGPKTEIRLNQKGIKLVRDLKKISQEELQEMFGKWGSDLWRKARGQSQSPVTEKREVKSISEEETFEKDTLAPAFILERLGHLCETVARRLERSDFKSFKTVAIKARFSDFKTYTRAHTLPKPTHSLKTLKFETIKLLAPFLDRRENPQRKPIRLIGVKIEKLD